MDFQSLGFYRCNVYGEGVIIQSMEFDRNSSIFPCVCICCNEHIRSDEIYPPFIVCVFSSVLRDDKKWQKQWRETIARYNSYHSEKVPLLVRGMLGGELLFRQCLKMPEFLGGFSLCFLRLFQLPEDNSFFHFPILWKCFWQMPDICDARCWSRETIRPLEFLPRSPVLSRPRGAAASRSVVSSFYAHHTS